MLSGFSTSPMPSLAGTTRVHLVRFQSDVVAEWKMETDNNLVITLKKGTPDMVPPRGVLL